MLEDGKEGREGHRASALGLTQGLGVGCGDCNSRANATACVMSQRRLQLHPQPGRSHFIFIDQVRPY